MLHSRMAFQRGQKDGTTTGIQYRGSDWPHVAFKGSMPNTTDPLDRMLTWVMDESLRTKILVDNPAKLYGF